MARTTADLPRLLSQANARLRLDLAPVLAERRVAAPSLIPRPRSVAELLAQARRADLDFAKRAKLLRAAVADLILERGILSFDDVDLLTPSDPELNYPLGAYTWACAGEFAHGRNVDIALIYYAAFWRLSAGCFELLGLVNVSMPFYLGLSRPMAGLPFLRVNAKERAPKYLVRLVREGPATLLPHLRYLLDLVALLNPREAARLYRDVLTPQQTDLAAQPRLQEVFANFDVLMAEAQPVEPEPVVSPRKEAQRWQASSAKFFATVGVQDPEALRGGMYGWAKDFVRGGFDAARRVLDVDPVSAFIIVAVAEAVAKRHGVVIPAIPEPEVASRGDSADRGAQLAQACFERASTEWMDHQEARYRRLHEALPPIILDDFLEALRSGAAFDGTYHRTAEELDTAAEDQRLRRFATLQGNEAAQRLEMAAFIASLSEDDELIWKDRAARYAVMSERVCFLRQTKESYVQTRTYARAFFQLYTPPGGAMTDVEWRRAARFALSSLWREDPNLPRIQVDGATTPSEVLHRIVQSGSAPLWEAAKQEVRALVAFAPWLGKALRGDLSARSHLAEEDEAGKEAYEKVTQFLSELP